MLPLCRPTCKHSIAYSVVFVGRRARFSASVVQDEGGNASEKSVLRRKTTTRKKLKDLPKTLLGSDGTPVAPLASWHGGLSVLGMQMFKSSFSYQVFTLFFLTMDPREAAFAAGRGIQFASTKLSVI